MSPKFDGTMPCGFASDQVPFRSWDDPKRVSLGPSIELPIVREILKPLRRKRFKEISRKRIRIREKRFSKIERARGFPE